MQVRYAHYLEAILYNDLNPASEPVFLNPEPCLNPKP
jgi:hypothetical protein